MNKKGILRFVPTYLCHSVSFLFSNIKKPDCVVFVQFEIIMNHRVVNQDSKFGSTYADFHVSTGMNLSKKQTGIPRESFPKISL